jgi:hypothetical protein
VGARWARSLRSHFRNKPGAVSGCSSGVSGAGHQLACRLSDPCYEVFAAQDSQTPSAAAAGTLQVRRGIFAFDFEQSMQRTYAGWNILGRERSTRWLAQRHTFHRCTRRRLRARFHLALPLSRPSQSDSVVPVRHEMAISQQMGASGSQTRRLTHSLITHRLTESQPSTTFCLATWPGPDRQGLTPLAGPGSSPQVATDLQGLVLKRTSVELALIIFYRCMWLLLFENRGGWNLRTCTNGRNPEDLERLPTSPTWC